MVRPANRRPHASLYHRAQQLPSAAAHYSEAVRLMPTFFECHANLGHVLRDSGDLHVRTPC